MSVVVTVIEYEVTVLVEEAIAEAYEHWLHAHIRQILALPGFIDAQRIELLEPHTPGHRGWCVRYRLRDEAALADYLREHAPALRQDGVDRFGSRFQAQRRVLRHHHHFPAESVDELSLPR